MKYLMMLVLLYATAHAGEKVSCDNGAPKGSECEVIRVVTRCDVEKQALRHRIAELEKQVRQLDDEVVAISSQANWWMYRYNNSTAEKETIKHHIISVYMNPDISGTGTSGSGGTKTAYVQTSYEPGLQYQYQFNFGLVPEVGINVKGSVLFGLGYEF